MPAHVPVQFWLVVVIGLAAIGRAKYVYRYLAHSPSDRDITRAPEDLSWRTRRRFAISLAALCALGGLAVFIFTPYAAEFAHSATFWPLLMAGFGLWALTTVALGFANGQIEPMIRGNYNHYQRDSQPKRFWASMAWNASLGCLCILLAFELATPAVSQPATDDVNRCFDIHNVSPQDELAACNKLLVNRDGVKAAGVASVYLVRSFAYDRLGDHQRAIDDLTEAVNENPDNPSNLYLRGVQYYRVGDNERAIRDYSEAIRLKPDYFYAFFDRGTLYSKTGAYRQAIADFDEAIRLKPNDSPSFNNRGEAYLRSGDLAHAMADYSESIRLDPAHALASNNRGNAYLKNGELPRAIADFSQAIRLKPELVAVFRNRAEAYARTGDLPRAIADLNEAIRLKPGDAGAYYGRGIVYGRSGDLQHAIADFSEAIRLKPDYAKAYYYRGIAYEKAGSALQALADHKSALRLDPNVAKVMKEQTQPPPE